MDQVVKSSRRVLSMFIQLADTKEETMVDMRLDSAYHLA